MPDRSLPDAHGRFGPYGGQYVPETLMPALIEMEAAYRASRRDAAFKKQLADHLKQDAGRPTPLYFAERLSLKLGGRIYLKREDLCHTGAHKINNTIGQALLAMRMGKSRVIAETGAGQHGVAVATAAARFGLSCTIYMGTDDMARQALNVVRMRLLGAEVRGVETGSRTLKDAISEAMRDWTTHVRHTHYILGSVLGPHPYPMMIRNFQSVIGQEARRQILYLEKRLPNVLMACIGGGSNAIGLFYPFLSDTAVRMIGIEAGGEGIPTGRHAARFATGSPGVLHGSLTQLLQDQNGQILTTHSISAGLDYAAVGPEHSYLRDAQRVTYTSVTDQDALAAFEMLTQTEGILPALESSHALAYLMKTAPIPADHLVIVNLSGRGDKDVDTISRTLKSLEETQK